MRTFVIDGYNLLHQVPELAGTASENLEDRRERLIRRLVSLSAGRKLLIHIVFDTARIRKSRSNYPGIRVDYAKPSADAYIRRIISENQSNRNLVVVSSDRKDIGEYAKTCGIEWMTSKYFWRWITKISDKNRSGTKRLEANGAAPLGWTSEDNTWLLRIFNEDDGEN